MIKNFLKRIWLLKKDIGLAFMVFGFIFVLTTIFIIIIQKIFHFEFLSILFLLISFANYKFITKIIVYLTSKNMMTIQVIHWWFVGNMGLSMVITWCALIFGVTIAHVL